MNCAASWLPTRTAMLIDTELEHRMAGLGSDPDVLRPSPSGLAGASPAESGDHYALTAELRGQRFPLLSPPETTTHLYSLVGLSHGPQQALAFISYAHAR